MPYPIKNINIMGLSSIFQDLVGRILWYTWIYNPENNERGEDYGTHS